MKIFTKALSFVNFNNQVMNWVKFNGQPVYEAFKTLLVRGISPLTLLKSKGVDLIDYKIYGESVQDGIPTPDSPVEVQSVGDKSVNLVEDVRKSFKDFAYYTELEVDGRQCIRVKSTGGAYAIFDFAFKENTQYTISFEYKCQYDRDGVSLTHDVPFAVYYTDGSVDYCNLSQIDGMWRKRILTTDAGKTISHIKQFSFDYRVYNYIDINTFQIQEGNVATEYEPYGYKIPVTVSKPNIYKFEDFFSSGVGGNYFSKIDDNSVLITNYYQCIFNVPNTLFKPNTTYEVSKKINIISGTSGYATSRMVLATGRTTGGIIIINGSQTTNEFTTPSDLTDYTYFWIYGISDGQIEINDIVIREKGTVTTNIYLNEPLRKIGEHKDYIDFENQKIYRKIGFKLLNGNEDWAISNNSTNFIQFGSYVANSNNNPIMSDKFPAITLTERDSKSGIVQYNDNAIRISLLKTEYPDITTVEDLKILLNENNIKYYFILKAEETIELPNIPTYKGTTIIEVDTSINPSNMEVAYLGKA